MKQSYQNYPPSQRAPDVPYKIKEKSSPAVRGWVLVIGAWLLENFGFVRGLIWRGAGFGDLRMIRDYLENYEPRYEPNVVPFADPPLAGATGELLMTQRGSPSSEGRSANKYYTVTDYHALYLSGEVTPTAVVQAILPLIRRDLSPPGSHSIAWVEVQINLILAAAKASTLRYKEKRHLGILDGVPTAVKDEYDVDGYRTRMGSPNDYTWEAPSNQSINSWCVKKLEEAGAINLGKLNMHEFGLDTTNNNPHDGTPLNPHNPNYYTGGSSGGCGYAVSSGLIPIALGSDGGGSIRIPASFCSVYGLKPTHGRVSHKPLPNYCNTCAVNGPLAADIDSLSAFYRVVGTPDPSCPSSSLFPAPSPSIRPLLLPPSTDQSHQKAPSRRKKILGIPEAWFSRSDPSVQTLCRSFLDRLVSHHDYTLVPITIPLTHFGQIAHALTILTDAATLLPASNPKNAHLNAANRILIALGSATPSVDYLLAQKLRQLLMQHLASLWEEYPGMIIVTPTTPCAGWRIGKPEVDLKYGVSDGDMSKRSMEYVWLANFAGCPSLTMPVGFVPESDRGKRGGVVPVGLMGTGQWGSEEELLEWGRDGQEIFTSISTNGGGEAEDKYRTIQRPPNWVDVVERARREMT